MKKMNQNDVKGLQNECKCQNENYTTVDNTLKFYLLHSLLINMKNK